MLPKIVVLGADGMLGHKMFQVLRNRFPGCIATTRQLVSRSPYSFVDFLQGSDVIQGVDATDSSQLKRVLGVLRPDYIVNCVGLIKQRNASGDAVEAMRVNSLLPHQLAQTVGTWSGRLIHFSTDCVFSGRRGDYSETDLPDAEDLYGRSKSMGEVLTDNALTLRTSFIGRELTNHRSLLDWFMSQDRGVIQGFTRVIYSGVTTNHIADLVARIISDHHDLSGLYQVSSAPISKFDLLCRLREAFGLDIQIRPNDSVCCNRSMSGTKLQFAIGYTCPSWDQLIEQLAKDPTPYSTWKVNAESCKLNH